MHDVCAWAEAHVDDRAALTFVGSSLGGYYATWLAEKYAARAVVINPAVRPTRSLAAHVGPQCNAHTGQVWELTQAHFAELEALWVPCLTQMSRYFLLMRSGDELLDWRDAVARYAGAAQYVQGGGDHGWEDIDDEIFRRFCALPALRQLADRMTERCAESPALADRSHAGVGLRP